MLATPHFPPWAPHFRVITSVRKSEEKRESHHGAKPKWRRRRLHHYRHHRRQDIVKLNLLSTHSMCI